MTPQFTPAIFCNGATLTGQCREHMLGQLFPERTGQTRFAQDQLGILALHLGKQLIDQLIGNSFGAFGILLFLVTASWFIGRYFRYRLTTSTH
ncbi:hypothetical protein [Burkholderia pyrrocinia]|uniref:hypothetical protein n=1 Tax=Burkholderia pyrrocinia TaxID=60550 RepID=UPI0035C69A0C